MAAGRGVGRPAQTRAPLRHSGAMSETHDYSGEPRGPIAYMASNPVAANLLMFAFLAAGLVSVTGLERESWPVIPFKRCCGDSEISGVSFKSLTVPTSVSHDCNSGLTSVYRKANPG